MRMLDDQTDFGTDDPFWVDKTWLDTIVVFGLSCFVLCLMNLSKVSTINLKLLFLFAALVEHTANFIIC